MTGVATVWTPHISPLSTTTTSQQTPDSFLPRSLGRGERRATGWALFVWGGGEKDRMCYTAEVPGNVYLHVTRNHPQSSQAEVRQRSAKSLILRKKVVD